MSSENSGGGGGGIGCLVFVILIVLLVISNPSDVAVAQQMSKDGWVPVALDRKNLGVFSFTTVTGFTGAKGIYVGVAGQSFQVSSSPAK